MMLFDVVNFLFVFIKMRDISFYDREQIVRKRCIEGDESLFGLVAV